MGRNAMFNPIAFRKAKIVYNFGLSECSRVKKLKKMAFYCADLGINFHKVDSLVAIGAVGVRELVYLGHSISKAEPVPLSALPYPFPFRKRERFPVASWPNSDSNPGTSTR